MRTVVRKIDNEPLEIKDSGSLRPGLNRLGVTRRALGILLQKLDRPSLPRVEANNC